MLYEVAVIEKPTQRESEEGKLETVLVEPKTVVALNEQAAALIVVGETDALQDCDKSRLDILVRPFA